MSVPESTFHRQQTERGEGGAATPYGYEVRQHQVGPEEAHQRLDRYVQRLLTPLSRTAVQRLIEEGAVRVNGEQEKAGYTLRAGDVVEILWQLPQRATEVVPRALPLEIVYEDDDLLVVNKAAGMVVHPAPGHEDDTLVNALLAYRPQLREVGSGERPGLVHRLDKDTSGLLLVAKHQQALTALAEMMQRRQIHKRYLALVVGQVPLEQGTIEAPIGRDPRNRQLMTVTAHHSREARTHFRVVRRFSRHTLLSVEPETGRTHQIRVHLKAIGYPVAGDPVYGSSSHRLPGLTRQFLHAAQLVLPHPMTGVTLKLEAPLPADLQNVLAREELL
ncbi:RluA family pseudouridine synthase [Thermogemmatispora sp.]|uniref:RluA family pseudouridine synthase n=1 Tax=Thermogemmatispora sp. TaxID=1968838 RepID=UPI001D35078A|nr:RluA family pseudouridine synthase [Thermogemmatispora sp.]MBX5448444.1 RluA family pseudouridine synthase [Thermogemmatispora sp.]